MERLPSILTAMSKVPGDEIVKVGLGFLADLSNFISLGNMYQINFLLYNYAVPV